MLMDFYHVFMIQKLKKFWYNSIMKLTIELIKQFIFLLFGIVWKIIKENWEPFYTTLVKMAVISLIIFGVCQYVPHDIAILSSISYLGWLTIIVVYRFVTFKYDDFEYASEQHDNDEVLDPIMMDDDDDIQPVVNTPTIKKPEPNIMKKDLDGTTSTRE